eukprot:7526213-Prorocentrum_lima.AAC.1
MRLYLLGGSHPEKGKHSIALVAGKDATILHMHTTARTTISTVDRYWCIRQLSGRSMVGSHDAPCRRGACEGLSLIHISEPTRLDVI